MKHTLYSSMIDEEYLKGVCQDYNECNIENEEDYLEWDDSEVQDIAYRWKEDDWYCFESNAKYPYNKKFNNSVFKIYGTLGLWDGNHEVESYDTYNDIIDAINKCIDGAWDFEIVEEKGELIVYHYHHDGTNVFTIKKMVNGRKCKVHFVRDVWGGKE